MDIQKERELFEAYMAEKYKNLVDRRRCLNNGGGYMAWDMNVAWQVWQAAKAQAVPECTWSQNEDGYFDTSCRQSFVFTEPEDRPHDHQFTHCCFCGGKLIEAQEPAND